MSDTFKLSRILNVKNGNYYYWYNILYNFIMINLYYLKIWIKILTDTGKVTNSYNLEE